MGKTVLVVTGNTFSQFSIPLKKDERNSEKWNTGIICDFLVTKLSNYMFLHRKNTYEIRGRRQRRGRGAHTSNHSVFSIRNSMLKTRPPFGPNFSSSSSITS
jgi:hypothetical protein